MFKTRGGGFEGVMNNVKKDAKLVKKGIHYKSWKATQYFSDNYKGAPGFLGTAVET